MKKVLFCLALTVLLSSCSAEDVEYSQQKDMNLQAVQSTGMPAITRFFERRLLKSVYELRDQGGPTITYLVDMNGRYHKLCNSVGYGIPYSTQYSSPSMREPNSLYPPSSADGTWIFCMNPKTHEPTPLYVEPRVIVSAFELE